VLEIILSKMLCSSIVYCRLLHLYIQCLIIHIDQIFIVVCSVLKCIIYTVLLRLGMYDEVYLYCQSLFQVQRNCVLHRFYTENFAII
jgi:hypothetical protein